MRVCREASFCACVTERLFSWHGRQGEAAKCASVRVTMRLTDGKDNKGKLPSKDESQNNPNDACHTALHKLAQATPHSCLYLHNGCTTVVKVGSARKPTAA